MREFVLRKFPGDPFILARWAINQRKVANVGDEKYRAIFDYGFSAMFVAGFLSGN
jgi:hypothetical protein